MPIPSDRPGLGRTLLRDDVYLRLRDAIIDGTLAPGEQLRDTELSEWLGVSRTPVREALLRLGRSGLVIAKPGRSTIVSTIDDDTVRDARDVVASMHRLAALDAVPRMTDTHIQAMRDANQRFADALTAGDVDAALAADDALHAVPVAASGNHAITIVLEQFAPVIVRAERLRFASTEGWASHARHERFIDACASRDVEAAVEIAFDTWRGLFADELGGASAQ